MKSNLLSIIVIPFLYLSFLCGLSHLWKKFYLVSGQKGSIISGASLCSAEWINLPLIPADQGNHFSRAEPGSYIYYNNQNANTDEVDVSYSECSNSYAM